MHTQLWLVCRRQSVSLLLMAALIGSLAVSAVRAAPPETVTPPVQPATSKVSAILGLLLATDDTNRVIITDVPASLSDKIGVKKGDRLVSVDGRVVSSIDDIVEIGSKFISLKQPGEEIKIVISRNGQPQTFTVLVPERAKPTVPVEVVRPPVVETDVFFCMQLKEIKGGGLMVFRVLEQSAAFNAGIQPNDVIISVDRVKVRSLAGMQEATRGYARGQTVSLNMVRGSRPFVAEFVLTPCPVAAAEVPGVVPRDPAAPASLDQLSAKLRALQAQINALKATADDMAITIEAMRQK